jgi:hypothetical protein
MKKIVVFYLVLTILSFFSVLSSPVIMENYDQKIGGYMLIGSFIMFGYSYWTLLSKISKYG